MTDVHSCSYYCQRPECIKAQRDELRDRLAQPEQKADAHLCYSPGDVLSSVVSERNQLEAQRDALLEVLMLCQQAGLHKHILNTGESLASVVDAAIKQAEEKQK